MYQNHESGRRAMLFGFHRERIGYWSFVVAMLSLIGSLGITNSSQQ